MSTTGSLLLLAAAGARLGHAAEPDIPWLRIVLAFCLCIALAVAAIVALRRYQGNAVDPRVLLAGLIRPSPALTPRALRVEERIRLTAASQLVVLRWDEQRYLVHVAAAGAQLLDRRGPQALVGDGEPE